MIRLEVVSGQDAGRVLESRGDIVRIGRAAGNDLVLSEFHVSGEHATIVFSGETYVVRDLQSTNGTRVRRGGRVIEVAEAAGREVALESGDELLVGDVQEPVPVHVDVGDEADDARIVSKRQIDEIERVEQEVGADRAVLQKLYEAQKKIGAALELEQVIDAVAEQVFAFLARATHVTIALREEDDAGGRTRRRGTCRSRRACATAAKGPRRSRSRAACSRRSSRSAAAVLAADARREVGETASIMGAQILSTIGVPLWHGDEIIGVHPGRQPRGAAGCSRETDLDVSRCSRQTASLAFDHARLFRRLRVAEERLRKREPVPQAARGEAPLRRASSARRRR